MDVQRAIGEFIYTHSIEEQEGFIKRLNEYYDNNSDN
jgi:hypothetical protein